MDGLDIAAVVIALVAVAAPLLVRGLSRWVAVPIVVFELLLGIIVGPQVLGWVGESAFIDFLSEFGLVALFFIAGSEIEASALKGRGGRFAWFGWAISIAVGVGIGFVLSPGEAGVIIGIALASTALGALVPILRDSGDLRTPFGRSVMAVGTVGEFGPLIAITLFLGGRDIGTATVVLLVFLVVAAGAMVLAYRMPQGPLYTVVTATLHTSGQFAIRVMFLIIAALVVLSVILGVDVLLGAFAAGVIWRLLMRGAGEKQRKDVETKVEAVAFGFLIPVFFIDTGIEFDLASFIAEPLLILAVPVALVALLVVRGLPSMLAAPRGSSVRDRVATMFMGATALPIIVAVTTIGVDEQVLEGSTAAVLVGAGMLSVLLFPLLAAITRGKRATSADDTLEWDSAPMSDPA
ncbi:cation:proton antiporter [Microbacterium invictum]|uniref:Cation:proton antiporter n=1 Tax=Microbacterium invictum TaxID=515415 RepID=A0ABZ0VG95_9MICO|nr:cation:proton antiporter [Microbacterium invictum]WQB70822.1 cation:proton antiporter [Microbacterium invictum]